MDLPPSGWYPDPYGKPRLLRWWDGSVWTQHTHPDVSTAGTGASGDAAATSVQATSVQATAVHAAVVPATAVQAAIGRHSSVPRDSVLRRTKPPTGRPTEPQPALPDELAPTAYQPAVTTVQPAVVHTAAPAAYQPAVTTVQPATVPPTAYQPAVRQPAGLAPVQPTVVQPGYPPPGGAFGLGGPGGGGDGTQVMFMGGEQWHQPPGDGWQPPGDAWQAPVVPGMPGGPPGANRYGYQQAQRRRRRRVIAGISAGTAVAVAAIVLITVNLGGKPASTADQTQLTPAAAASTTAPPATPSASPSASASPTATAAGSLLSDSQSGLSYAQLAAPWQGGCPASLNNGTFTWTDGEYAVAGQVNGSTAWYGEACSGPLPADYGYNGSTGQLQNVAEHLAQSFAGSYYNALQHSTNPEQDQAITVGGHQGWEVGFDTTYSNAAGQGATWSDEQAAVVVVDPGTGAAPGVFFVSVPQNLNEANVNSLISSLQVTGASPAGASASASGAPSQTTSFGTVNP
jgi:Protein of unknown function (DUF2510)